MTSIAQKAQAVPKAKRKMNVGTPERPTDGGRALNAAFFCDAELAPKDKLTTTAKMVLTYIGSQMNFEGTWRDERWVARSTLAEVCSVTVRSITRAVALLKEKGFLVVRERFHPESGQMSNAYSFTDFLFDRYAKYKTAKDAKREEKKAKKEAKNNVQGGGHFVPPIPDNVSRGVDTVSNETPSAAPADEAPSFTILQPTQEETSPALRDFNPRHRPRQPAAEKIKGVKDAIAIGRTVFCQQQGFVDFIAVDFVMTQVYSLYGMEVCQDILRRGMQIAAEENRTLGFQPAIVMKFAATRYQERQQAALNRTQEVFELME